MILEQRREEAYVEAIQHFALKQNVVGVMGQVPTALFWAIDRIPIRLYGIHKETIQYSIHKEACDLLQSTEGYALMDKCPFIHSSSLVFLDDLCEKRIEVLQGPDFPKETYLLSLKNKELEGKIQEFKRLETFLEETESQPFSEERLKEVFYLELEINKTLLSLKYNLKPQDYNSLTYQLQFIFSLEDRLVFLQSLSCKEKEEQKKTLCCPPMGGIYEKYSTYLDDSFSCDPCSPKEFEPRGNLWEDLVNYYTYDSYRMDETFRQCPFKGTNIINY